MSAASRPSLTPERIESEPERARRILWAGVLAYRAASFAWMAAANLLAKEPLRHPVLGWTALALIGLWTVVLIRSQTRSTSMLMADLALSFGLVVIAGYVAPLQNRIFYATTYPASSALAWGAARGRAAGLAAGLTLSVGLALSRLVAGVSFGMLTRDDLIGILNGSVYYLLAGGAAGVVTRTIDRSRAQVDAATEVAMRAREREGRMAEREALARRIHDSVLQAMADIHREGIELAREPAVSAQKVRRLAELAEEQERELRSILIREPEQAPSGMASLRAALEAAAQGRPGLKVVVTATGPIWLATRTVEELREAVKQALDNVTEHAEASRVAVFADIEDGQLEVSVRDDGRGFVYSEEFLRASNKAGMLKSMKGRVEELGGRMRVHSAVGVGTEVEFRIPVPERSDRA